MEMRCLTGSRPKLLPWNRLAERNLTQIRTTGPFIPIESSCDFAARPIQVLRVLHGARDVEGILN